jgi:chemotaxis protein CheX
MSIDVALIDFPRLQEQIATRLLSTHQITVHRLDHTEAAARLEMFQLALFFWPDAGGDAHARLEHIRANEKAKNVPVVLVASEVGKRNAESILGKGEAADILVTPLQPFLVSRRLASLLGLHKESAPVHLEAAWVNPFIEATIETLHQMAQVDCKRTGLAMRTDAFTKGLISGTMGLSGVAEGFVSITFNDTVARKIVCKMLQVPMGEETDDDIRDGVGELMNVIAGQAKAELVNTDHSFMLSLPTVIVGGPHSVGQMRGVPVMVIEFSADGEPFEVMVCLVSKSKH